MCFSSSSPTPPAPPPPPPAPPTAVDPQVRQSRINERRRSVARSGASSSLLTSARGLTDQASTSTKSLLGR